MKWVLVTQSCPTLCNVIDHSPPGYSVCRILQARTLEWVATLFSRESSQPRDRIWVSCIAGRFFTIWAISVYSCNEILSILSRLVLIEKVQLCSVNFVHAKSHQSCLPLCNPMDYSPPGFSVHGILQARILEWVAMPSSRGSSWPRISMSLISPELAGGFLPLTISATCEVHLWSLRYLNSDTDLLNNTHYWHDLGQSAFPISLTIEWKWVPT